MADFLTRLIARSRGAVLEEGRVEPLIAPLYAGQVQALSTEEVAIEQVAEVSSSPALRRELPIGPRDQPLELRAGVREEFVRVPARAVATPSQVLGARLEPDAPLPVAVAADASPAELQLPKADTTYVIPRLDVAATLTVTTEHERSMSLEAPSVSQPAAALPRAMVRPEFIGRAPQVAASAPPIAAPPSAPVTKVTIGRIDVRAVHTPASSAPRSAPLRPKLSLEDYLRTRNGRRE
jgi:hypothetical protein